MLMDKIKRTIAAFHTFESTLTLYDPGGEL